MLCIFQTGFIRQVNTIIKPVADKVQRARLKAVHRGKLQELHLSFCQPRTQRSLSGLIGRVMAEARYQSSLVRLSSLSADLLSKAPLAGPPLPNGTCCIIRSGFPMGDHQRFLPPGWVSYFPAQRQYLCQGSDRSDWSCGDTEGFPRRSTYPGIIHVAGVTTDTPRCDKLEM